MPANTVYDGRFKGILDADLVFWDGAGTAWNRGVTLASSSSSYSETLDLGADQVFDEIPAIVMFDTTATVSALSAHSTALIADKISIPGFFVQDASDGSTFSDISFVKWPADASFTCSVANWNKMCIGLGYVRRYVRLQQRCGVGTTGTVRAWLRIGLTAK
jgi:hypothetical protein